MRHLQARIDRLIRSRPQPNTVRTPEEHAALCASLGVGINWCVLGGPPGGYVLLPPLEEP